MFIDTHCHLTDNYVTGDMADVLSRASGAGVDTIICPTADPVDIKSALKIADTYPNIFTTIGIHPEYGGVNAEQYLTNDVLSHRSVVGVGEIGLDYHGGTENRDAQIKLFEQQLNIAKQYKMPVAIHTRDAEDDTAAILTGDVVGVMHCFTSSWGLAKKMLDRGFFFSASGIVTFRNADDVRETFSKIPVDRIVIETDSPYCAPVPYRGKVCEPAYVIETAKTIANIHNLGLNELARILRNNTKRLYPKIILPECDFA